jgi:hypothetical protein
MMIRSSKRLSSHEDESVCSVRISNLSSMTSVKSNPEYVADGCTLYIEYANDFKPESKSDPVNHQECEHPITSQ